MKDVPLYRQDQTYPESDLPPEAPAELLTPEIKTAALEEGLPANELARRVLEDYTIRRAEGETSLFAGYLVRLDGVLDDPDLGGGLGLPG